MSIPRLHTIQLQYLDTFQKQHSGVFDQICFRDPPRLRIPEKERLYGLHDVCEMSFQTSTRAALHAAFLKFREHSSIIHLGARAEGDTSD